MKTIALYSIKGGVGKTAAAVNLSHLASLRPASTLICDLDPQGASSFYFRITAAESYNSSKFLKGSRKISRHIKATDFENLDLLASDLSYRNLDIDLSDEKNPRKKLRKNLAELEDAYDYLFFDCPPNLTLLSESVFAAADLILVPLIPTTLSVRTYDQLRAFFDDNNLDTAKIRAFFSMEEKRKSMHKEITSMLRRNPDILEQSIPYTSEIEKMGLYRAPLTAIRPDSAAAGAYGNLWHEVRELLG